MGLQPKVFSVYLLHSFISSAYLSNALYQNFRTLQLKKLLTQCLHQQNQKILSITKLLHIFFFFLRIDFDLNNTCKFFNLKDVKFHFKN